MFFVSEFEMSEMNLCSYRCTSGRCTMVYFSGTVEQRCPATVLSEISELTEN